MNVNFLARVQMLFARTLMRHFHVPVMKDLQIMEGRAKVGLTNMLIYV